MLAFVWINVCISLNECLYLFGLIVVFVQINVCICFNEYCICLDEWGKRINVMSRGKVQVLTHQSSQCRCHL